MDVRVRLPGTTPIYRSLGFPEAAGRLGGTVIESYFAVLRECPTSPAIMKTAAMPIRNPPAKSVYRPCTQLCRTRPVASMSSPIGSNRLSLRCSTVLTFLRALRGLAHGGAVASLRLRPETTRRASISTPPAAARCGPASPAPQGGLPCCLTRSRPWPG